MEKGLIFIKHKKSSFLNEFKEFAMRGNIVDLAVGVVIGAAFGKISASLVNDLIMPFVGMFIGGMDLSQIAVTLPNWFGAEEANILYIGTFLSTILDFLIIAFVIFLLVKGINRLRKLGAKKEEEEHAPPPEPSKELLLLTEIRDLLKERK